MISIEEIKSANPIVDVVSEYLSLTKSGNEFLGLCPFHFESTPSFSVNPDKGLFFCFGCKAGGDVITFISKIESLSFEETLAFLAKRANLEFDTKLTNSVSKDFKLFNEYFSEQLFLHSTGKTYLKSREITKKVAIEFNLGYSCDENTFSARFNYLNSKSLIEAGIFKDGKYGKYFNIKNSLVFPIFSVGGFIVGFAYKPFKILNAKYINSPNRESHKKSDYLYGLYQHKKLIKKLDYCIVTEGYFDVLTASVYDLPAVGIRGSSISESQVRAILNLTSNVFLILDGDAAGQTGMYKSLELFLKYNLFPKIVVLEDSLDLDEYLKLNKTLDVFSKSISMVDFVIFYLTSKDADYSSQIIAIKKLLSNVGNLAISSKLALEFSNRLNILPDLLTASTEYFSTIDQMPSVSVEDTGIDLSIRLLALSFLVPRSVLDNSIKLVDFNEIYQKVLSGEFSGYDDIEKISNESLRKSILSVVVSFGSIDYELYYYLYLKKLKLYWINHQLRFVLDDLDELDKLILMRNTLVKEIREIFINYGKKN